MTSIEQQFGVSEGVSPGLARQADRRIAKTDDTTARAWVAQRGGPAEVEPIAPSAAVTGKEGPINASRRSRAPSAAGGNLFMLCDYAAADGKRTDDEVDEFSHLRRDVAAGDIINVKQKALIGPLGE